jgi:hypothetical protein
LLLPYGTVNNVLRTSTVASYSDELFGVEIANYRDTVYTWFVEGTSHPIATYTVLYVGGFLTAASVSYIVEDDLTVGISDAIAADNQTYVFPNPATDHIMIKNDGQDLLVQIFDLQGKAILSREIPNGISRIPLDGVATGIYIVNYLRDGKSYSERLVIE